MTKRALSLVAPGRVKARPASVRSLRTSLAEAEQALEAIRAGNVDVLVMGGPGGARAFTLEGADHGYRVLLEVMSEGVAKLTGQGIIAYCNARFAAILPMPLERTIGSSIHELVLPEDRDRFAALLSAGSRERTEGEFRLQAPGAASQVPVRLSVVPLTMGDDQVHCLVMTDLTEQRRQSDAIASERAAMHTRLLIADRMLSMGTVAAGVAHEINNPLACVLASLELMMSRLPDLSAGAGAGREQAGWLRRQLERAREGAARVGAIVRDLGAFSSADDETVTVVDLRHALDSSIALASNEIRHRARLVRDYDGLPAVRANEARLGQAFVSLLVNATQAIAPGAADHNEIRVSGYADAEGQAVVEIRDTGSGIPAEHLDRIFEPFFTTKAVGLGTGLGLALCHGVVSSFGGQITVESAPGAGSLFRIVMPAVEGQAHAPVHHSADARGRLLIIDDEKDLCEILEDSLAPLYDVVATTDARQALTLIAAGERFDMILCDVRMPEMTGLDFYATLMTTNSAQAGRVVLMSGGFTRHAGEPPLALPVPILEKPFELKAVETLMSDRRQRSPRRPWHYASRE